MPLLPTWLWVCLVIAAIFILLSRRPKGKKCVINKDLSSQIVIITGGNSGIGLTTAIELAKNGAIIVIACRNRAAGEAAAEQIKRESRNPNIVSMELNLSDLSSVNSFAKEFQQRFDHLDTLVLNAGTSYPGKENAVSADGYEIVFATNHLGHFALFQQLSTMLCKSKGRVVTVASTVGNSGTVDLAKVAQVDPDATFEQSRQLYANSKLCNILFAYELHRRYNHFGIKSYCLSPGLVKTNLFRFMSIKSLHPKALFFYLVILPLIGRNALEGAQTTLYCCTADLPSGKFYNNCAEDKTTKASYDEELAKGLWELSELLIAESQKKRQLQK